MSVFILLNVAIFFVLSMIHVYWAWGGSWGIESAIPERYKEEFFKPETRLKNVIATMIVAIGLSFFGFILASNYLDFSSIISTNWTKIATRIIGSIFLIRAIGDFNLVGLFKKKSDSKFAIWDTKLYIPLCLYLGISSIAITF